MPKAAKNPSPLRNLRIALAFTQIQMADIAKVTQGSYQQIELGKASLSPEVMRRIKFATGCRFANKNGQWEPTMIDWRGRDYTAESYTLWQKIQSGPVRERVDDRLGQVQGLAELIVEAGYREKKGLTVFTEVVNALDGIATAYELEKAMTAILGKDYVKWLSGFAFLPSSEEQGEKYKDAEAINAFTFFND